MGNEFLPYLKKCYTSIFDDVDEESITGHFKRFALCTFSGDKYGSSLSRGDRSSYILARWCALGGKIDTSGSEVISVKRVHGMFVPVFGVIQREHVLVVCPLPRKLHC